MAVPSDLIVSAHSGFPGAARSIGPIRLAPGVVPGQVVVFLGIVVCLGLLLGFISVLQPFILDALGAPAARQGRLTGNLAFTDQLGFVLFISSAGTLADTLGRRGTLIIALVGMVLVNLLFPFAATIGSLFVLRFVFGISRTAHTAGGTAVMMDYPDNASRGKFLSLMLVVQALSGAVLIGLVGARLPGWLATTGLTPIGATRLTFAIVAGAGLIGLWLAVFRLAPDHRRYARTGAPARPRGVVWSVQLASLRAFFAHLRARARFRFVMLMALVIRSDFTVMDAFVSLWILRDGLDAGLTRAHTLALAGLAYSVLRISLLVAPPIFGVLADRHDRTRLLALMLCLTAASLASVLLVGNATHWTTFLIIGLIGFCESGTLVVAQSILGEEAPAEQRGISMAMFALLGTLGVLVASSVGGQLFDRIGHAAPFLFVGAVNFIFAVWAVVMVRNRRTLSGETA